ncbi:MAG: DUF1385 domain-containing protein [Oscillospiraceae bacterium]|nr:DUF1385 domain-containing protein [Oscillospiraceae bacterium]
MPNEKFKTSIGGQALIEGVMMRGPAKSALAVRMRSGEVDLEAWDNPATSGRWYRKTPFVRGMFNMVDAMKLGYKCMMKSAEKSGMLEDEANIEPSRFEKWLSDKLGDRFTSVITGFSVVIGVVLAVGLFSVLPVFLVSLLPRLTGAEFTPMVRALLEGLVRIIIFVSYIVAVSRMKDIRRVFQYHGAEHKTISCHEADQELTVENVRAHSRFHRRCGTSFLLIVFVTSILIFSLVRIEHVIIRALFRFALLPVVISIAYEIIKFAGRHDNILTRAISAPGLWLQRLTSHEPDDRQIEVAIASMTAVIPEENGADTW